MDAAMPLGSLPFDDRIGGLRRVASSTSSTAAEGRGMRETIVDSLLIGSPLVLAPLGVKLLRPLYALFLREGAELFADLALERRLATGIAGVLVLINMLILSAAWISACVSERFLDASRMTSAAIVLVGLFGALALTVLSTRTRLGLADGRRPLLIGLLVFTCGNLPIFVLVPVTIVLI
jgi:hypothetical protein